MMAKVRRREISSMEETHFTFFGGWELFVSFGVQPQEKP
jgi:hypothetical protein